MAFLTDTDYKTLITADDLDIVMQSDTDAREMAEAMAQQQMTGYLNQRYDCEAIFVESTQEDGDARNKLIIMYMIDIALFHMHSQLPNRMGLETRRIRYEDAIKWLSDVAKGLITPDLPAPGEEDTDPLSCNWGSQERQTYDW
jgi:phage gp36-like protein